MLMIMLTYFLVNFLEQRLGINFDIFYVFCPMILLNFFKVNWFLENSKSRVTIIYRTSYVIHFHLVFPFYKKNIYYYQSWLQLYFLLVYYVLLESQYLCLVLTLLHYNLTHWWVLSSKYSLCLFLKKC